MQQRSGKTLAIIAVILGAIVLVALWFGGIYNRIVGYETASQNAWSNVEVQYQRRADLVPQLVSTVKGAANFEQDTLTAITEARTNWLSSANTGNRGDAISAANELDSAFARLLVTVENYPQLTATENFRSLQAQLEGTENRVSVARKNYNDETTIYNTYIRQVPNSIVASIASFDPIDLFAANEGSANAPEVNFEQ